MSRALISDETGLERLANRKCSLCGSRIGEATAFSAFRAGSDLFRYGTWMPVPDIYGTARVRVPAGPLHPECSNRLEHAIRRGSRGLFNDQKRAERERNEARVARAVARDARRARRDRITGYTRERKRQLEAGALRELYGLGGPTEEDIAVLWSMFG